MRERRMRLFGVSKGSHSPWIFTVGPLDLRGSLCGTFLPCILECKVAQDSGETCCVAFLPGSSVALRTHIRHKYRIEGSVCNDWCVMACLYQCGLCQMAREQKMRA
ncbi:cornifelin homolog isoform X3 [Corythoichthys intestinalis]|uniref:cornifelin homolog isoform X3 n=1 Tax=Corythoichthys intestinalis TaxID=161448 RepID=UPI0025A5D92E|nr:cornifelin homolog isoform X3 [Corythoichthys intestinalis]